MNGKELILPILALCLFVGFSGLCVGEDKNSPLIVKRIEFTTDKIGGEWISLLCNQSCTPELSFLDGENPRVVMDMKGVSLIQTKTGNINTGGKLVKRIRNYLDKETNILRVVLDLEPSKSYIVRPRHDATKDSYLIMIYEDTSISKQKPGGSGNAKSSPLPKKAHIVIIRPDLRPAEQTGKLREAAPSTEKRSATRTSENSQSLLEQGKSQLYDGDFAAAVDIFTKILSTNPQDSLVYRLRGDAYDNLGDQEKALEDWTQAARLGDTIIQSHLDFLDVKWRENPAP
jgi:hypothetical protein